MFSKDFNPEFDECLLKCLMDHANDLICVIESNYDFKIELVNEPVFLSLLGYANEDLIKFSILNFIHHDDVRKAVKILKRGRESTVLRLKHKSGTMIWVEIKARKLNNPKGGKKLILIMKDLSLL